MYMIVCVIDQADYLTQVLQAWQQQGISGVTILESTGLHRLTELPHVPMRYMFGSSESERGNITLFTIVEHEETIQRCLELTEAIVGDFSRPNAGIFVAWPLSFSKGVIGKHQH